MQNSQNSPTSNPIVAKLLEADADLATEEVELAAQLQSIQEKRHSLKTVIDLFSPAGNSASIATPAQTPQVETEVAEAEVASDRDEEIAELEAVETDNSEVESSPAPVTANKQAKKNSSARSQPSKKAALTKQASKESDTWHQYVNDEFSNTSLAEAVSEVMQRHAGRVLEIATILDDIFVEEIPQKIRSKARERVSNVLSVGVKNRKWYREATGSYRMSDR